MNCRNVTLRDFTIYHGGHFGALEDVAISNLTMRDIFDVPVFVRRYEWRA